MQGKKKQRKELDTKLLKKIVGKWLLQMNVKPYLSKLVHVADEGMIKSCCFRI